MSLRCALGLHRYRFVLCNERCRILCRNPCVARCSRCEQAPAWTWYLGEGGSDG